MNFKVTAKVDQIVTKQIDLVVAADSEEQAEAKAREALAVYPQAVEENVVGIKSILTTKQHFWIPKSIEFGKFTRKKD